MADFCISSRSFSFLNHVHRSGTSVKGTAIIASYVTFSSMWYAVMITRQFLLGVYYSFIGLDLIFVINCKISITVG